MFYTFTVSFMMFVDNGIFMCYDTFEVKTQFREIKEREMDNTMTGGELSDLRDLTSFYLTIGKAIVQISIEEVQDIIYENEPDDIYNAQVLEGRLIIKL